MAQTWSNDYYGQMLASRNRYRACFMGAGTLCGVLVVALVFVTTRSYVQLVVVHAGSSGYSWVTTVKPDVIISPNWLRTQSEIRRYILAREAFDPFLHDYQEQEVLTFSSDLVRSQYQASMSKKNKYSLINIIGAKGYRTVRVNSILKVGDDQQHNLAQVSFVTTDHIFGSNQVIDTTYNALISWQYRGVPKTPEKMLENWDGFTVVRYEAQPENT